MKTPKIPTTLKTLLTIAGPRLWKGLAYERTAFRSVEEFIEIVGDLPLSQVTTITMDDYLDSLDVAPATINRKLTNIHSVLKYALEREWIQKIPKMSWQREEAGRVRWLSPEEETQMFGLLRMWGETDIAHFLAVLIETGMRRGELLTATPAQIDGQWLRLWKTKTKTARSVPLSPRALEALKAGMPWNLDKSRLRTVWDKLRVSMKMEQDDDFVLHMLRHTAATRVLKKTKNLVTTQRLLGHASIKTTVRYAHLSDDDLLAAVQ